MQWLRFGKFSYPILPSQVRSKMRLTVKVGFVCGLCCIMAACQEKIPAPQAFPVAATRVQARQFAEIIQAEGTLVNPGYIELRPQVSGSITQVLVNEGDPVRIGQILVVLDNAEQMAELRTAQEELKEALIQAKRWKQLASVGGVQKEQAEEKQIAVVRAKSKVVAKQEALNKRSIRSPINGVIGDLTGVNPGQYLKQGGDSFFVVNNKNLSIDLSVPALQASKIKLGQRVQMLDESNTNIVGEGKITFIPPYFEADTKNDFLALNTLRVRAAFVNEKSGLRPNQLIRSKIVIGSEKYPGLPATAALFKAQQPYTYKLIPIQSFLKDNDVNPQQKDSLMALPSSTLIAVDTPLKLGALQDDYFSVLVGLEAGDLIAVSGSSILANGTPVSIESAN